MASLHCKCAVLQISMVNRICLWNPWMQRHLRFPGLQVEGWMEHTPLLLEAEVVMVGNRLVIAFIGFYYLTILYPLMVTLIFETYSPFSYCHIIDSSYWVQKVLKIWLRGSRYGWIASRNNLAGMISRVKTIKPTKQRNKHS